MGKQLEIAGRFLVLAAILPGLIYIAALYFYLPSYMKTLIDSTGINSPVVILSALIFILGVLFSSVCFAIELFLRNNFPCFKKRFPGLNVKKLAELEAKNKPISYLYQLFGQAFMHFNIWMGILLIMLYYVAHLTINCEWEADSIWRVILGIVFVIANYSVSKNFFSWAKDAIEK
jgi:hypothetical protein